MNALEISNLTKSFGSKKVINDISFTVPQNRILGFIGQNGAGKTTTMKMILGLLRPDNGNIDIYGERVSYGQTKTNRHIGYLPDVPEYYGFLNAIEYLELCGNITGMAQRDIQLRTHEMLNIVGLTEDKKKRVGGYSRGMKQRLGLAQALLNGPKLLICDEPTSALDPIGRKEILDILKTVKENTTVIFSTHILSDVERICNSIVLLHQGSIALSGTLAEIKSHSNIEKLRIEFKNESDLKKFSSQFVITSISKKEVLDRTSIILHSSQIEETQTQALKFFYENSILPISFDLQGPTLETLFMEVLK